MGRKPKKRASFFKVIIKDFSRLLRLPPVFMQKYGSTMPENVKLRINSGRTWDAKVQKMEDGRFCFTRGWGTFAEDVGLKFGEFLIFRFDYNSIFDVTIYETSACERENPCSNSEVDHSDSDEDHNARDVINKRRSKARSDGSTSKSYQSLKESSPLYFEILLKQHHRSRISLTRRFCEAAGLMGNETVGLEYVSKHCYQSVKLDHRPLYRIDMAKGWPAFRKANGIVFGKNYSFEFKPSNNVIQVKEVKKGN